MNNCNRITDEPKIIELNDKIDGFIFGFILGVAFSLALLVYVNSGGVK